MMYRPLFALIAVTAIAAGCSNVKVIDSETNQNYYDGAFEFATLDGTIKTAVVGSPFSKTASDDFARSVTSTMRGAPFGREVEFIPSGRNKEKNAFHVVVVFNGVHPFTEEEVCENDVEISTRPNDRTTRMHAVFCQGGHPLSYATGFVDNLQGPADPNFRKLVKQVGQAMIPRFDDEKSSGGEGTLP